MASVACALRTCGILLYLIFQVRATKNFTVEPWIVSLEVEAKSCVNVRCKYSLLVKGSEFLGHYSWKLTSIEGARGSSCDNIYSDYEINEVETTQLYTRVGVMVPNAVGRIYFCLRHNQKEHSPFGGAWVHQGGDIFLEPKADAQAAENVNNKLENEIQQQQTQNDLQEASTQWADLSHDIDVNYLPNLPRPTRDEENDIEVYINKKYVPLNHISDVNNAEVKNYNNFANEIEFLDRNTQEITNTDNFKEEISEIMNFNARARNYDKHKGENQVDINNAEVLNYNDFANQIPNRNTKEIIENDNFNQLHSEIFNDFNAEPGKDNENNIQRSISDINNAKVINYDTNKNNLQQIEIETFDRKKREIIKHVNTIDNKNFSDVIQNYHDIAKNNTRYRFKREIIKDINGQEIKDSKKSSDVTQNYDGISKDNTQYRFKREIIKDINGKQTKDSEKSSDNKKLAVANAQMGDIGDLGEYPIVRGDGYPVMIDGLRVEDSNKEPIIENGIPSVLSDTKFVLRLFGQGLTPHTVIAFTHDMMPFGQPCKFLLKGEYLAAEGSVSPTSALFEIRAPSPLIDSKLYICAKNLRPGIQNPEHDEEKYLHQGIEPWKMLATHNKLLPLWVSISLILTCLMFSALFSGLNLGLMSLDRTELKIIANTGTEQERNYAKAIMPVRDHGNYLLCSILLGNVAVNSTFTILLDELTSGLFAVIFSTLAIVLLGEITPQAICSRHGLMVGAKSIMITKAVMALTAPLAFPVSKLLDYFLGEEIGNVYNRERLKELVKVTTGVNDLDKDEVNIISGALEMRKKTVSDVMTKLEDVFMLPISSVLDFETMSEIVKSGFSRIPVYESARTNIVTVLFIKDLAFVDPDDNTPLRTLCQYYQNPCNFVFEDVTLDVMFKQFKEGNKGHMAFVHRINNEGEGDPFYETIGLVTLEDVIEEMIQAEIVDETDVFTDNRSKRRRNRPLNKLQDFAAFAERHENQRIHISPQLTLATFQFLSTSVDAFKPDTVSETVLRRLLRQDVIQYIKMKGKTKREPSTYVFQQGKPVDYFVLILEGRVEVTVGRENLVFEAGPFTYFGVQALTQNVGVAESPTPSAMGSLQNINMEAMLRHTFVPDYSVRAVTDVYYLTVKRSLYLAAKRATLMEKGALSKGATNEQFDTEVDKLLESVDEDISISGDHKTPSRQVSPNPPASASPLTRASFASRMSPERNGDVFAARATHDEQEKLLKH
ncbi:unextended protein-like isoform X2 [Maniola hyperantus]|uniref:unextended protein-like isoform X2 n=1 Tax=Aphantopus hyperantus TaxID=2795564 RepID=UPI003748E10E